MTDSVPETTDGGRAPPPQKERIEQILRTYEPMAPVERPHVFIGIPAYGGQLFCGCAQSLMDCLLRKEEHGVDITIRFLPGESLIPRGRNTIVAEFISRMDEYTHLFFIDADISFSCDSFFRLVKCNHPISASIYPKKSINCQRIIEKVRENPDIEASKLIPSSLDYVVNVHSSSCSVQSDRFVPVSYVGTGFMCIRREVIKRMIALYPQRYVNDIESVNMFKDHFYLLFDCMVCPSSNRYLSEDYAFCQKALNCGVPIFADLLCPLTHTGNYQFSGWWLTSLKLTRQQKPEASDGSNEEDERPKKTEQQSDDDAETAASGARSDEECFVVPKPPSPSGEETTEASSSPRD